jgi:hypothetical protein
LHNRRSFLLSGARGLLVGCAALGGSRKLRAQDSSMGMNDALNPLIQCWNQFGPNGDSAGVNWTTDPNSFASVVNAYGSLAATWSSDGTDQQLQQAVFDDTLVQDSQRWLTDAAGGAYEHLLSMGANVTFYQFWSWYGGWGASWESGITVLQAEPLSSVAQDMASALSSGGDPTMAATAVMLGAAIASSYGYFGVTTGSPVAAAGDIAAAVAMLGGAQPTTPSWY